jgi:superfamily II DNA or RNA helicase
MPESSWPGPRLRGWQERDAASYLERLPISWTQHATPGSGKTVFAGYIAWALRSRGLVRRVHVVVPTEQLREQWVSALWEAGQIRLDPDVRGDQPRERGDFVGSVTTYAMLAQPGAAENFANVVRQTPTLLIVDECHHAGKNRAYGVALQLVATHARYRLLLTGTPFRTTRDAITLASFNNDGSIICDGVYAYSDAMLDHVCRQVEFCHYNGGAIWIDADGVRHDEQLADLDVDDERTPSTAEFLRPTVYSRDVLAAADRHLDFQREEDPRAAGLVIASDIDAADGYARQLRKYTGHEPVVVHKDIPEARKIIEAFGRGSDRWLVAVAMVSEGTDIPRLTTLVYLSNKKTPLHFRQAVGRVVRRRDAEPIPVATVFLPSLTPLIDLARSFAEEVAWALEQEESATRELIERDPDVEHRSPQVLGVDSAVFDQMITHDGGAVSAAEYEKACEVCRQYGVPEAHAGRFVLMARTYASAPVEVVPLERQPSTRPPAYVLQDLRGERAQLLRRVGGRWGADFRKIGRLVAEDGGGYANEATIAQHRHAVELLKKWLVDGVPG